MFLLVPIGPILAIAGWLYLSDYVALLGAIMLFASGGILYLIFQDIAPQSRMRRHWAPPLGAVLGFGLGMLGANLLHGV
jgi:ZIP family zinc transporter